MRTTGTTPYSGFLPGLLHDLRGHCPWFSSPQRQPCLMAQYQILVSMINAFTICTNIRKNRTSKSPSIFTCRPFSRNGQREIHSIQESFVRYFTATCGGLIHTGTIMIARIQTTIYQRSGKRPWRVRNKLDKLPLARVFPLSAYSTVIHLGSSPLRQHALVLLVILGLPLRATS